MAGDKVSDKVRLYDLAKEMHLEGKDVLAACDQQAIPYKSISSTINSHDAELLRSLLSSGTRPQNPDKADKPAKPPAKSQQILSISQQKPQPVLTPPAAPSKAEPKPKLEVKPEPAQPKPQMAAPASPTANPKPVKPAPARPVKPANPPSPPVAVKPKPPEPRKPVLPQKPEIPQSRTPKPVKNSVLIERGITAPTDPPRPLRPTTPPPARPAGPVH